MDRSTHIKIAAFLLITALVTVVCATGGGDTPDDEASPISAQLTELSGDVQVLKKGESTFQQAVVDTQIEEQDQVLTGDDGRARMDLSNGTIIRLSPLSNFILQGIESTSEGPLTQLELTIGQVWIILQGGVVEVDTPSGVASVRGSYMHVWVDPQTNQTYVTCLEGTCTLSNEAGTVTLIAGQTATIKGSFNPPVADKMSDEEVQAWLDVNPEATLVIIPLTQTVEAFEGTPLPESETNTPTPTGLPTSTPTATPTSTISGTPADCGPPEGWVLHTVKQGETLDSLSALYRVDKQELREANCRGSLTFITAGEKLYVPNVATSTPTNTPTPTPLATETPDWTATVGAGGATWTPTNDATIFSDPVGPDNKTIPDNVTCKNPYRITVKDANGIDEVKMIYTFDGSLPNLNTATSAGYYVALSPVNADIGRYSVSDYVIDTTGQATPVNIRFRFAAVDGLGNVAYSETYDLTDKVNCAAEPTDTPTTFNSQNGPNGDTISDPSFCSQTFTVNISEPDGVTWVRLVYTVDGGTPTSSTSSFYEMIDKGSGTWEVTAVIDSSIIDAVSVTIKYVYAVKDNNGIIQESAVYSYMDTADCGATTFLNQSGPTGNQSTCDQAYSIDVFDDNGVKIVEVNYDIQDINANTPSGKLTLTNTSGDKYSVTTLIDTTGAAVPTTIQYGFYAKDKLGHGTTLVGGQSFTYTIACP